MRLAALLSLPVLFACSAHPSGSASGRPETTLPFDGGAVQWDGWAGEFVTEYCVQCHNPKAYCTNCHWQGDPRTPDYTQKAQVVAHAATIRCGVSVEQRADWDCGTLEAGTFPKPNDPPTNPMPSDVDRDRMVGWINAGCP